MNLANSLDSKYRYHGEHLVHLGTYEYKVKTQAVPQTYPETEQAPQACGHLSLPSQVAFPLCIDIPLKKKKSIKAYADRARYTLPRVFSGKNSGVVFKKGIKKYLKKAHSQM